MNGCEAELRRKEAERGGCGCNIFCRERAFTSGAGTGPGRIIREGRGLFEDNKWCGRSQRISVLDLVLVVVHSGREVVVGRFCWWVWARESGLAGLMFGTVPGVWLSHELG